MRVACVSVCWKLQMGEIMLVWTLCEHYIFLTRTTQNAEQLRLVAVTFERWTVLVEGNCCDVVISFESLHAQETWMPLERWLFITFTRSTYLDLLWKKQICTKQRRDTRLSDVWCLLFAFVRQITARISVACDRRYGDLWLQGQTKNICLRTTEKYLFRMKGVRQFILFLVGKFDFFPMNSRFRLRLSLPRSSEVFEDVGEFQKEIQEFRVRFKNVKWNSRISREIQEFQVEFKNFKGNLKISREIPNFQGKFKDFERNSRISKEIRWTREKFKSLETNPELPKEIPNFQGKFEDVERNSEVSTETQELLEEIPTFIKLYST